MNLWILIWMAQLLQEEAVVTREWLEIALKEANQAEVVNIVKIEFERVSEVYWRDKFIGNFFPQGVHKVFVLAKIGEGFKEREFCWTIQPSVKQEGRGLIISDLLNKIGG